TFAAERLVGESLPSPLLTFSEKPSSPPPPKPQPSPGAPFKSIPSPFPLSLVVAPSVRSTREAGNPKEEEQDPWREMAQETTQMLAGPRRRNFLPAAGRPGLRLPNPKLSAMKPWSPGGSPIRRSLVRILWPYNDGNFMYFNNPMWPGILSLPSLLALYTAKELFLHIFLQSSMYGKVLVLDGIVQLTERDECAYQEMIAHLPLCSIPSPKTVITNLNLSLFIVFDIKNQIVGLLPLIFPGVNFFKYLVHGSLTGIKFLRDAPEAMYDVIIVDSSDPIGPARELVEKPFFEMIARALKPGGVLCNQAESMWLHTHLIQDMLSICREIFKSVHYAWASVPTYPRYINLSVPCFILKFIFLFFFKPFGDH
ncbi:hypothetical protein BHE74_00022430, partial [Ensete ventricosum]